MEEVATRIAALCAELAMQMAPSQLRRVADLLNAPSPPGWGARQGIVLAAIANPGLRTRLGELMGLWQALTPPAPPQALALALRAAGQTAAAAHPEQVDLVWTGPEYTGLTYRRTDQALRAVIAAAQQELLLVSFAVYMMPTVAEDIVAAHRRGVTVRICLETQLPRSGQRGYDPLAALGDEVCQVAQIYSWPLSQRRLGPSGRPGLLHAKCAVADATMLFLSSANLTGQAHNVNLELGLLVQHGSLPGQVAHHFRTLMGQGTLVKL